MVERKSTNLIKLVLRVFYKTELGKINNEILAQLDKAFHKIPEFHPHYSRQNPFSNITCIKVTNKD